MIAAELDTRITAAEDLTSVELRRALIDLGVGLWHCDPAAKAHAATPNTAASTAVGRSEERGDDRPGEVAPATEQGRQRPWTCR
ncbi:hypothetical protein [Actinophytocola sp.]|uniref:hypothetical protein n=1 Tax=Actinophytocola sp. TaxID=1872138 RepID=UPI003D6ACBF6